jgi:CRP-like cAMP-binding protein
MSVTKEFAKGETILLEGSVGDRSYKLISGNVLICKQQEGNLVPIIRLEPGEIFGEMFMLNPAGLRSASAIAATDVTVEIIFAEELAEQLHQVHPAILGMIKGLSNRLNTTSTLYSNIANSRRFTFRREGGFAP